MALPRAPPRSRGPKPPAPPSAAKPRKRRPPEAPPSGRRPPPAKRRRLQRLAAWIAPPYTRRVSRPRAVVILVLNVAPFPGLGTALYGHWERGLMQFFLTFVFLVGWFWAVFDGFRILSAALRPPRMLRPPRAPQHG